MAAPLMTRDAATAIEDGEDTVQNWLADQTEYVTRRMHHLYNAAETRYLMPLVPSPYPRHVPVATPFGRAVRSPFAAVPRRRSLPLPVLLALAMGTALSVALWELVKGGRR